MDQTEISDYISLPKKEDMRTLNTHLENFGSIKNEHVNSSENLSVLLEDVPVENMNSNIEYIIEKNENLINVDVNSKKENDLINVTVNSDKIKNEVDRAESCASDTSKVDSVEWLTPEIELLQVKPKHWTDEYWQSIMTRYKWFLHKDDYIGCGYCHDPTITNKRKGLIPAMKLYLMDLSFDDLETKLIAHRASKHHMVTVKAYRASFRRRKAGARVNSLMSSKKSSPIITVKKSPDEEFSCPLCVRQYKTRKALTNHINLCKADSSPDLMFPINCNCEDEVKCRTFVDVDIHNFDDHNEWLSFCCSLCKMEIPKCVQLFSHYLLVHNYVWNPHNQEEMPLIIINNSDKLDEKGLSISATGRPARKRSVGSALVDNIYIHDDEINHVIEQQERHAAKRQKFYTNNEYAVTNTYANSYTKPYFTSTHVAATPFPTTTNETVKPTQKTPTGNLEIPDFAISYCTYCGGRYLTCLLDEHIQFNHSDSANEAKKNKETNRAECYKRLNNLYSDKEIKMSGEMQNSNVEEVEMDMIKKSAAMLICSVCQEKCGSIEHKIQHISLYHSELEQVTCKYCGLIFSNQLHFSAHMKSHDSSTNHKRVYPPTHSCVLCPLVFTNASDLENHIIRSHNNPEQALVTPENEITPMEIEPLIEENNGLAEMKEEQNQSFELIDLDAELLQLLDTDYSHKEQQCPGCDLMTHNPYELLVHKLSHVENGPGIPSCPSCNRLFFGEHSKQYLMDHFTKKHRQCPLPTCPNCQQQYSSTYLLSLHTGPDNKCRQTLQDNAADPYEHFHESNRLAFCCPQCSKLIAGENAEMRMNEHTTQCSQDMLDQMQDDQ